MIYAVWKMAKRGIEITESEEAREIQQEIEADLRSSLKDYAELFGLTFYD
jgi:hypothetical protein